MKIIPFNFDSHEVRVLTIDGEPWFVGTDVTKALGLADGRTSINQLDEDERHSMPVTDSLGREQMTTVVNESGLYSMILRSRKVEALRFKKWITKEVIPSIRKTGSYGTQPALNEDQIVQQAMQILTAKTAALESKVAEDAPKVEYVDKYVSMTTDVIKVAMVAAGFGMTEPALRKILQEERFAYRKFMGKRWSETKKQLENEYEWMPYKDHLDHFDSRPQHNAPRLHNGQLQRTLYVTPSGVLAIEAMLNRRFATIEEEQN